MKPFRHAPDPATWQELKHHGYTSPSPFCSHQTSDLAGARRPADGSMLDLSRSWLPSRPTGAREGAAGRGEAKRAPSADKRRTGQAGGGDLGEDVPRLPEAAASAGDRGSTPR